MDAQQFNEHLKRAKSIVDGWPEWKRNILEDSANPTRTPRRMMDKIAQAAAQQVEASHTPGPWEWTDRHWMSDGSGTFSLIGGNGYGILSCDGFANSPQTYSPGDAYLIAAAPDLLAALIEIAAEHECGCKPCVGQCVSQESLRCTVDAMRDIARDAILKAKGGA